MLKKFLIGTFVAAAFMVVASTASADCSITTTLRVGSTGTEVSCLQTKVGATADGKFGPMTKASVMAYQASHGLSSDGVVGPMSRAVLNAGGAVSGSFSVGCTSASGFSTTTGLSCISLNANTFAPSGCTSASGFSPVTGGACYATSSTIAGCTAGALFSSTTGASCTTGVVTTTTGALVGGAGDINVTSTTTDVEDQVIEGSTNTKILGFKVEASGSDVSLTSLKVSLKNTVVTTASYRLGNVASEVAVWMGGTKVGSALVSDFSKDTTTNGGVNVYSKSIALTNAVVRNGVSAKQTFYVTITALPNIDTTDMTADNWAVFVNNIRFQDATGVVMTSSETEGSETVGSFEFATLANSGDAKVVISKGSGSPITQEVAVTTAGSTKNVLMLEFKVKTTGTTASFDSLNTTTALVTTGADTYTKIVGDLTLKDNAGNELASIDGADLTNVALAGVFTLAETYTIPADTTQTFRIYATINDASNFTTGATLSVSLPVTTAMVPEDSNGGIIADTGSASGSVQTFVFDVPTIALSGTPTLALLTHTDGTTTGLEDTYIAKINYTVTAPDSAAIYVPLDSFAYGVTGAAGVIYTTGGNNPVVTSANTQFVAGTEGIAGMTESASYRIDAGTSQTFTLTVNLTGNDLSAKVRMTGLWYAISNATPTGTGTTPQFKVTGLTNLYTPLVTLSK